MPDSVNVIDVPEVAVTAEFLRQGKQRLSLTTQGGEHSRYGCENLGPLCQFVETHSPVEMTVRLWGVHHPGGAILVGARTETTIFLSDAGGQHNFSETKSIYRQGVVASFVAAMVGVLLLTLSRRKARS